MHFSDLDTPSLLAQSQVEHGGAVDESSFDLILMDVQMPVMDGLHAARLIREREKSTGGHVPILAMTAAVMKEDQERCTQAGMDGHIAKPLKADQLCQAIADALRTRPETCSSASRGLLSNKLP